MLAIIEHLNGKKKRSGQALGVYLLLRKRAAVLLSLRKNTGYFDGYYGLVSGHVEDGESMTDAIIREAKEEANLILNPKSLQVVHLMHRKSNQYNVDVFFECTNWEGKLMNMELNKCGGLQFFSLEDLPSNMIPYIQQALHSISAKKSYSEEGWPLSSRSNPKALLERKSPPLG